MSSKGVLEKYCGNLCCGRNISVKKVNMKVHITVVICDWGGHFVFWKISSVNRYCFCNLKKHCLSKPLYTNYIMKLHVHCHSLYSRLGLCSKAKVYRP